MKIWDYAKISHAEYQNLSKKDQFSLFKVYYNDILIRFDESGIILSSLFEMSGTILSQFLFVADLHSFLSLTCFLF